MTTEETHLNTALEAAGMQVVETDLGEYIIQLAEEPPSHIIAPAIHKTRGQIAELFNAELGMPLTDDVARLTAPHAQRCAIVSRLRMSASAGSILRIAETGTIVIVENEGNIRLTTSLPRVHIAVMGIEKVLPRFADLDVFLKAAASFGNGTEINYLPIINHRNKTTTD